MAEYDEIGGLGSLEDERSSNIKGIGEKGRRYADFSAAVKRTLFNILDLRFPQVPISTGQHNKWDLPMQSLSGLHANQHREKFEVLRDIPPSDLNPILDRGLRLSAVPDEEVENWKIRNPDADRSDAGLSDRGRFGSATSPRLLSNTRSLARKYMASKPGSNTSGCNVWIHGIVRQLIERRLPVEEVEESVGILVHRREMIAMAEGYVRRMGRFAFFGPAGSFDSLTHEIAQRFPRKMGRRRTRAISATRSERQ